METKKIFAITTITFLLSISSVFAFGEVAGPVVIHASIGGSGIGMWGLAHNETVKIKLTAEGNASKYISLPSEITLQPTGTYWVNVTATIPADYNVTQGTNITGVMYALLEGSPGQVQINLRLKKNIYILVEQPSTLSIEQLARKFITGLFALESTSVLPALGLVILVALFYFAKIKRIKLKRR